MGIFPLVARPALQTMLPAAANLPPDQFVGMWMGRITAWKEIAAGQAGRAAVFAAMLARIGIEGPHLPFEGKSGWCEHVAREPALASDRDGR